MNQPRPVPVRAPANLPGARVLSPRDRDELDLFIAHRADDLRRCAVTLGGMVEHYADCQCGEDNPNHNALVLVIPEPYLSRFAALWPEFRERIEAAVPQDPTPEAPLTQGA